MPAPDTAADSFIRNLEQKTGRPLSEWVGLMRRTGLSKHGEMVKLLKADHGLTHGYANLVAHRTLGSDAGSLLAGGEDLIGAAYAGPKAALRPIHDAIAAAISGFGDDVTFAPKKGYVSVRRTRQFALIQPSTATRLDVGIQLRGTPPGGRLEASGSFNAMVSHRVRVTAASDVDAELIAWLREAYEAA